MDLSACRIIDLPKISDSRGNISFIESFRHIPFTIRRVYYLYDVPGGESRGGHAHYRLEQFLISVNGSFDTILDDGNSRERYQLNRPYYGLYIPPGIWRELDNFSSGSVCLVLASEFFTEEDYIREYPAYINYIRGREGENPSNQENFLTDPPSGSSHLNKAIEIRHRPDRHDPAG